MKRFMYLIAVVAAGVALAASCTKPVPTPVFPEKVTATVAAGQTQTLTLTPNLAWVATIDKEWCRFVVGDDLLGRLEGAAGVETTITLAVSDLNWTKEDETATVELKLGDEFKAICEITRPGKGNEIRIYAFEGMTPNPEYTHDVVFEFADYSNPFVAKAHVAIAANFDWTLDAAGLPEFIDAVETIDYWEGKTLTGAAVNFTADFNPATLNANWFICKPEYALDALTEDVFITLKDTEGADHKVAIKYEGVPSDLMMLVTDYFNYENGGTVITFNNEGYAYKMNNETGDIELTETLDVPVKVAGNLNYEVSYYSNSGSQWSPVFTKEEKPSWVYTEDDTKGNLTIGVGANTGAQREIVVAIVPKGVVLTAENYSDYYSNFFTLVQKGMSTGEDGSVIVLDNYDQDITSRLEEIPASYLEGLPVEKAYAFSLTLEDMMYGFKTGLTSADGMNYMVLSTEMGEEERIDVEGCMINNTVPAVYLSLNAEKVDMENPEFMFFVLYFASEEAMGAFFEDPTSNPAAAALAVNLTLE